MIKLVRPLEHGGPFLIRSLTILECRWGLPLDRFTCGSWPVPRKYALRPVDVSPVRASWCMMAHVLVALEDIYFVYSCATFCVDGPWLQSRLSYSQRRMSQLVLLANIYIPSLSNVQHDTNIWLNPNNGPCMSRAISSAHHITSH